MYFLHSLEGQLNIITNVIFFGALALMIEMQMNVVSDYFKDGFDGVWMP